MRRSATRCPVGKPLWFPPAGLGRKGATDEEALAAAKTEWVFISGGARLYAEAMPLAEMLYLTEIDGFFQGDVFFPPLLAGQFARVAEERHDGEIPYVYVTYRRYTKNGKK